MLHRHRGDDCLQQPGELFGVADRAIGRYVMSSEITIVGCMAYPDEIFQLTEDLVANWERYALIVSHTVPFENLGAALELASTPGAADKVVVTFP